MKTVEPDNRQLIDDLADHVASGQNSCLEQDKKLIARRIRANFLLTLDDVHAIETIINLVETMTAEDSDLAHQSHHMIILGLKFGSIRDQLLARMNGQRNAYRET